MPEGPEIRRAADRVSRVLVGKPIVDARLHLPGLTKFARRLTGQTVTAVDTRGKAMLTRFDNGLTLYSHNQLYGRWYTVKRPRMPQTNRQLRVELHTSTHSALLYSASDIDVLTEEQLTSHSFLERIGPDVMDRRLNAGDVRRRLESPRFAKRATGSLFIDQSFIAGLGNYLRSEILFVAGIHPSRRPSDLEAAELERLGTQTIRIARRSYRTRGVTVAPSLDRELKQQGWSFGERRFYVFGRDGLGCHECDNMIERVTVSGRNLFLCPFCQAN
jgi:endonuclease-8